MLESEPGFSRTCGSSVHMATLQLVRAEKQAKYMSVWSINNKKHCFCTTLWESAVGERNVDSFPTEGASATICTSCGKPFSPQHSTIHQWLLQSYWAFSRHLHILDKRNKKHFKATLPAVPTLFHLSNAYKTVEEGQTLLRGATAHLLPASAPLKTLLFLLKKEYTINLAHLLSWATILSLKAQTGPSTLTSII